MRSYLEVTQGQPEERIMEGLKILDKSDRSLLTQRPGTSD